MEKGAFSIVNYKWGEIILLFFVASCIPIQSQTNKISSDKNTYKILEEKIKTYTENIKQKELSSIEKTNQKQLQNEIQFLKQEVIKLKKQRIAVWKRVIAAKVAQYHQTIHSNTDNTIKNKAWITLVSESPKWWQSWQVPKGQSHWLVFSPQERKSIIAKTTKNLNKYLSEYINYFNKLKQRLQYIEETYPLEESFAYGLDLKAIEANIHKWKAYQQKLGFFLKKKEMLQAMMIHKASNFKQLRQELSIVSIKTLLEQKFLEICQKRLALYYFVEGKKAFAKNSIFSAKEYLQKALKLDDKFAEAQQWLEKVLAEEEKQAKNQDLQVEVSCPRIVTLNRRFRATIHISNTSEKILNKAIVSANVDSLLTIISAEEGDISENSASWKLENLLAGQSKVYHVVIIFNVPRISNFSAKLHSSGTNCLDITVNTSEGNRKQVQCCIGHYSYPLLLLETMDSKDPLNVNEETTYNIEITNQGTYPQFYIKIDAIFPAEISPIALRGDTKGFINGKKVLVTPYPILFPKERIKWEIKAKALQPGDARVKVYLTSDILKTPVVEEESTHVY